MWLDLECFSVLWRYIWDLCLVREHQCQNPKSHSPGQDYYCAQPLSPQPLSIAATQFWRSKVLEVAKDFPEYTFAIADEEDYATEVKDLGLSESGEDVNAAILDESGKKFAMEPEEFDSDTLREFVTAFKKGELSPKSPFGENTEPAQVKGISGILQCARGRGYVSVGACCGSRRHAVQIPNTHVKGARGHTCL